MLRLSLSVLVISLLAACSSVPPKSARSSSGMAITTPRAYAPPRGFPNFVDHSVGREEISIQAMSLVGVPYRWGGNTPDSGFDCSGLVRYVVDRAASVNLPRTTADMSSIGESIEPDGIAPGDLIFFNTSGRPHSHVGIYVGKLRFVNAPSTGGTVRLDYLTNPYWAKRFDGIRRVAAPKAKPAPFDAPTYQASRPPEPAPRVSPAAAAPAYAAVNAPAASAARAAAPSAPGYAANSATPAAARAAAPPPSSEYAAHSAAAMASAPASAAPLPTAVPAAATAATAADPYEPPPSARSAARRQAQAAGARSPVLAAGNPGGAVPPAAPPAGGPTSMAGASAADPIDAAADAFEPPPPTARAAARQAQLAAPGNVQVLRASTAGSAASAAATGSNDDPIARFANGGY
ncbi:C40 family peptidase [Burkholderia pseudomallei]|uniref:C40 family peptidase n=1 Tax=Burkholderia pseudomallei TaxID=28450 RepID=UPI00014F8997|nr:C40 family peptidase [Burkholderia pseudomallei]AGR71435.1 nlpC/P60 family protein [Burkholderia pseudomallei MSHR305]AHK65241.1 nlpC/P60 family protein [Burkholderia pseudomallei MSHR520]AIP78155.1 nlpC/P60 family protein [Burkholderia pseudomallei]APZ19877.1 hydrolase Nlp/P60 [Burkholderia pseudomallei]APZ26070.1 hydrolase Nlp/P60 [Burkholderia pseudomallei]